MKSNRSVLIAIAVALATWGGFHALGAYRNQNNPLQAVLVIGCMLAFLAFWATMLWSRTKRLRRQAAQRDKHKHKEV